MLSILARSTATRLCDGVTRRELMRVGGLSLFAGATLPRLLQASRPDRSAARAKSVILFNLLGGASQMDMFDLKPTAPAEVRGEFRPILLCAVSESSFRVPIHSPHKQLTSSA